MWSECSCAASSVVFACLLRDKWSRCEIANVFQVLTSTPTPLLQASSLPYTTVMVCISPTSILIFSLFANSWELFRLQRVIHNQTISGWLSFLVFIWEVDFVDLVHSHSAWVFFQPGSNLILWLWSLLNRTRENLRYFFATVTTLCSIHYSRLTVLLLFCNYSI